MKNIVYILVLTALFSLTVDSASATIFRINNALTENITGRLFKEIQTAHDHFSVRNGDTLMVESSSKAYDGFTLTKRLIIIGPGYFLGENPNVNGVVASAKVGGYFSFNNGSQGTYFIGMESSAYGTANTSNIYFIRCKLFSINFNNASNSKVAMSHIEQVTANIYTNNSGISITNCIIGDDDDNTPYSVYENNILTGTQYSTWKISAGTFRNNILLERDAKVEIKSPNSQNNLAPNEQFGTANGNRAYEAADLFVGGTSRDGKYRLKASSPYIAAGYGGTQPGIFGGAEPYVLSGIPPIPVIYELNVPGTGSAATGLNINVKIRGAN